MWQLKPNRRHHVARRGLDPREGLKRQTAFADVENEAAIGFARLDIGKRGDLAAYVGAAVRLLPYSARGFVRFKHLPAKGKGSSVFPESFANYNAKHTRLQCPASRMLPSRVGIRFATESRRYPALPSSMRATRGL